MKHTYELRNFNDNGSMTTVLKIAAEPKCAKERAKDYANRHPGIYSLYRIEEVKIYFTERES